jgi:5-methylcytosine-specific restriction endonuclease McrA
MGKSTRRWLMPWWIRHHHRHKAKAAELRVRDGDSCWRCNRPMRFDGPPNCGKAATIEHLNPRSKGGTWHIDNLRLVHVGCNRHLGARTPEQKERMRINVEAVT